MSRAVVVGGGLAGITAALAAADSGAFSEVSLLEAGPRLGGLTRSFHRPFPGGRLHADTGQHVFLRCCTAYLGLLDRLGVADQVVLQPRLRIPVLRPGAAPSLLSADDRLPAPLHLGRALLRYRPLPLAARMRAVPAALALRGVDPDAPAADAESFHAWLTRHGQRGRVIEALWELIATATLNATAHDSSLALAATVFQRGLLSDPHAADLGWPRVPLEKLHAEPARERLGEAGVEVVTRARARGLRRMDDGSWRVLTSAGEWSAALVVLAVPPDAAEDLLPAGAVDLPAGWAARLGAAPIVNAHVVLDRPVLDEPFAAGLDTPVQWVFDRTRAAGLAAGAEPSAQYLTVSLSAPGPLARLRAQQVLDLIVPALRALLPRARAARVLDAFVTREPAATFRPAPGVRRWRPPARTTLPGLVLAGAWTDTGWPATMEGAVRSGQAAVAAGLDDSLLTPREGPVAA